MNHATSHFDSFMSSKYPLQSILVAMKEFHTWPVELLQVISTFHEKFAIFRPSYCEKQDATNLEQCIEGKFQVISRIPGKGQHWAICHVGRHVFVFGGFTPRAMDRGLSYSNIVERFDLETKVWQRWSSIPCSGDLYATHVCHIFGKMYVHCTETWSDIIKWFEYDLLLDKWSDTSPVTDRLNEYKIWSLISVGDLLVGHSHASAGLYQIDMTDFSCFITDAHQTGVMELFTSGEDTYVAVTSGVMWHYRIREEIGRKDVEALPSYLPCNLYYDSDMQSLYYYDVMKSEFYTKRLGTNPTSWSRIDTL